MINPHDSSKGPASISDSLPSRSSNNSTELITSQSSSSSSSSLPLTESSAIIIDSSESSNNHEALYRLYGVITHRGITNSGYFISFIKEREPPYNWYSFDDRLVTRVPDNVLPFELFGTDLSSNQNIQMKLTAFLLFIRKETKDIIDTTGVIDRIHEYPDEISATEDVSNEDSSEETDSSILDEKKQ